MAGGPRLVANVKPRSTDAHDAAIVAEHKTRGAGLSLMIERLSRLDIADGRAGYATKL